MKTKTPLICYDTETGNPIESDETLLKKYNIKNYLINDDGSLNVFDDVSLYDKNLNYLPFEFNYVGGQFYCAYNKLESLQGCPISVGGDFNCSDNDLPDLKGGPISVGGDFFCSLNNLPDLKGAPISVGGFFSCSNNNKLESLKGAPISVGGDFSCSYNSNLPDLKGAPDYIGGVFYCHSNNLTDFRNSFIEGYWY